MSQTYPIVTGNSERAEQTIGRATLADFRGDGQGYCTGRLLDGSEDHGYVQEWAERGVLADGKQVEAIYLLDDEQAQIEDLDRVPWADCLSRFRVRE